jgi:hypothetical protein
MTKIAFFTPDFIAYPRGASEKDSLGSLLNLKKKGFDVTIVMFADKWSKKYPDKIQEFKKKFKNVHVIYFKKSKNLKRLKKFYRLDGYTDQYFNEENIQEIKNIFKNFNPELIWLDFTYMWPISKLFKSSKIIIRSKNFEPFHFISENGFSFTNILKFIPKFFSEIKSVLTADIFLSITPKEKNIYSLISKKCRLYPLSFLNNNDNIYIKNKDNINLFFSGSTYNVNHNKKALLFTLNKVLKELKKQDIKFNFFITGSKLPKNINLENYEGVYYNGFIPEEKMKEFYMKMDANIAPIISGAGMQSKIFQPMALGLPTFTFKKGISGFDFRESIDFIDLNNLENLKILKEKERLDEISNNCFNKSKKILNYKFEDVIKA